MRRRCPRCRSSSSRAARTARSCSPRARPPSSCRCRTVSGACYAWWARCSPRRSRCGDARAAACWWAVSWPPCRWTRAEASHYPSLRPSTLTVCRALAMPRRAPPDPARHGGTGSHAHAGPRRVLARRAGVMSAGLHGGELRFDDAPQLDGTVDFGTEAAARPAEALSEKTDQFITRQVGGKLLTELIIRLCNDFPTTEREVREFEEQTRMKHDKLDEVVEGMLGSSIGQNMSDAEREQMRGMFQKQSDAASAAKVQAEQTAEGRHAARVDYKKGQGNEAFKAGNYQQAAVHYTEALTLDDAQHALYSNRAACFLKLGRYAQARDDAQACVKLAPAFAKGHFRLALALQAEEQYGPACAAFAKVLELEPNNKDAKSGLGVAQMQAERQRRQAAGSGD
eukprot:Transcript_28409.p1 GENE.Transcript_28409~~Transcript_28409.p1  ORF type:complete len:397 (-),score=129.28 Transcript_28409:161-1351(-)